MTRYLSRGSQYAVQAMVHLAAFPEKTIVRQSDVSEATGVPLPYLSKILAGLARAGLVVARRGPTGGVRIARHPATITVGDILRAVDGTTHDTGCLLGHGECNEENPCALHGSWVSIRRRIEMEIHGRTLAELQDRAWTAGVAGRNRA